MCSEDITILKIRTCKLKLYCHSDTRAWTSFKNFEESLTMSPRLRILSFQFVINISLITLIYMSTVNLILSQLYFYGPTKRVITIVLYHM